MNIEEIRKNLYTASPDTAIEFVKSLSSEEALCIYAKNYNWDNGFELPKAILSNPSCTLNVALTIFWLADGITYLQTKDINENLPEWSKFISDLYGQIISNAFCRGSVEFDPELSKMQLYKLSKLLSDDEKFFIKKIDGKNCNIIL